MAAGRIKTITKRSLNIAIFLALFCVVVYEFAQIDLLKTETNLMPTKHYLKAELAPTTINSRRWVNHAMQITTSEHLSPPAAARFYAYVASVYSDVLETAGSEQASLATAAMVDVLFPNRQTETQDLLKTLNVPNSGLGSSARKILDDYTARASSDNFSLAVNKTPPSENDKWYFKDGKIESSAMAELWQSWIVDQNHGFDVPPPPKVGSLGDKLELQKTAYALKTRKIPDLPVVYIWYGASGFEKNSWQDNTTVAGLWQNILLIELTESHSRAIKDSDYAKIQKILAQSIADASIQCWKVKYQYWTQRPSMRIPNLDLVVGDPNYPGYVADGATLSATAAEVLTYLVPEKKQAWLNNLTNAIVASNLAGIQFDIDNKAGANLGRQIGQQIINKLAKAPQAGPHTDFKPNNPLLAFVDTFLLKIQPPLKQSFDRMQHAIKNAVLRPSFANAIADSGIERTSQSLGAAWSDYDSDGLIDLMVFGSDQQLFHHNPDGTFEDRTREAGLQSGRRSFSGAFGDYDNDGCPDLYMTTAGGPDTGRPDMLYKNNCDGTFTETTEQARISDTLRGRGMAWTDYDNDGFLDIYVANHGLEIDNQYYSEPNILYHNNRDGTFTDVTKETGVLGGIDCPGTPEVNPRLTKIGGPYKLSFQPIWFDYDNDGDLDLYVATDSAISPLYRNDGDGTFEDWTYEAGMCKVGTGMGVTAGDYDNDGDLDLYVTNTGSNYFWQNNGDGTFEEIGRQNHTADANSLGWGANFLDYDNDGDLDLYVVNGRIQADYPGGLGLIRIDKLYRNNGDKTFTDVAEREGIYGNDAKEAGALADYDGNGFIDLFVVASYLEESPLHRLYQNRGNNNNWITIQLIGTKSNRDAVGARISLTVGETKQIREVVSGSSYISQSSLSQTFGVGQASKIDLVEIIWPSGIKQKLPDVAVNQKLTVTEQE